MVLGLKLFCYKGENILDFFLKTTIYDEFRIKNLHPRLDNRVLLYWPKFVSKRFTTCNWSFSSLFPNWSCYWLYRCVKFTQYDNNER